MSEFNFQAIESKWQKSWSENQSKPDSQDPNLFYNLTMFPYPSGSKLHLGHWYTFSGTDMFGRYQSLHGKKVFQPMGFDSFGLPAENFAIKTGVHPSSSIDTNVKVMVDQIKTIGGMFHIDPKVTTSTPEYYKWTQWVFLELFKKGLAYKKEALVNWDPIDQTVLANEQVLPDGTAERSGAKVVQKSIAQWFLKITDYAEELLDFSDCNWPEKTKLMQTNWIGKSTGSTIKFPLQNQTADLKNIEVYTTRPDTTMGVTYVVVAPEHKIVEQLTTEDQKQAVTEYVEATALKSEIDRSSTETTKTGCFTGSYCLHPITGEALPIWIADYAIASYGTGCVMAVPAHDQRDYDFAKTYQLPIKQVIESPQSEQNLDTQAITEPGTLINSGEFDGLTSAEAKIKITEKLESLNLGQSKTNYRLRDWSITRQRYWGCPTPIVYDPQGNPVPVPEEHLPWLLPTDVEFRPTGTAPLAQSKELLERTERIFGKGYTPEVDTLDTFMCSSWYYLRFPFTDNDNQAFDPQQVDNWTPVNCYTGGPEHACMHLLYARFIHKVMRDLKNVKSNEPFQRLVHQGLITKDGAKMSKSKGNVVSPDDYTSKFGADVFRMHLAFQGPFEEGGDFSDGGIIGVLRFRDKLVRLFESHSTCTIKDQEAYDFQINKLLDKAHKDYENFQFNTVVSALMEFYNAISKTGIDKQGLEILAQVLAPIMPHLAEEFWQNNLGHTTSIFESIMPQADTSKLVQNTIEMGVQVNGKLRGTIQIAPDANQETAHQLALESTAQKFIEDGNLVKTIYIPGKILNYVVK